MIYNRGSIGTKKFVSGMDLKNGCDDYMTVVNDRPDGHFVNFCMPLYKDEVNLLGKYCKPNLIVKGMKFEYHHTNGPVNMDIGVIDGE